MQQAAVYIDETLLIDRLATGDPGAREFIYDHYSPALYHIILQVIPDTEKAENALARVFVYIFNDAPAYKESGAASLFGWMMRSARQIALKFAGAELPGENGLMASNRSLLLRFTGELPAETQTIFRLCYYKGLSKEAVSRMLGLTPEDVDKRLKTAMIIFRKYLNS